MATQKQTTAAKKMVENGGIVSKAMVDAGYSPATAKTPQKLTESKGYKNIVAELQQELENVGVTPKKIAKAMKQGLGAMQYIKTERVEGVGKERLKTEEVIAKPDLNIRHKYLDTSLKVLSGYPAEDKSPTTLILAAFKSQMNDYMEDEPEVAPKDTESIPEAEVIDAEA